MTVLLIMNNSFDIVTNIGATMNLHGHSLPRKHSGFRSNSLILLGFYCSVYLFTGGNREEFIKNKRQQV